MSPVLGALRRHGPTVFGLLLLVGALYVVQREFRHLSMADIRNALSAVPGRALWLAAGWTVIAYAVLTIYDRLGSVYAGRPVSYLRSSLASFCAYTLAHNLGFAAVSGAAVRFRFYAAWGLTPAEIAKVIAFTSLTFGLGGMALGGAVLLFEPEVVPWLSALVPRWAMQAIGIGLFGVVAAYVVLSRIWPHFTLFGHRIDLPGFRMALLQTGLAAVDVAVTTMIFYVLLPEAPGLHFMLFLGIYLAAYSAGLAANVPGGLGVFDTVILVGLQPYLPAPQVIGALLLFRLFYYIIPLFLSGLLFAGFEISQRRHLMQRLTTEARVTDSLEVPVLAGLSGLSGVALIFVGALPAQGSALAAWAGDWAALASHFAASVIGSMLLVVAYGMLRRLRIARLAGILLLALGAFIAGLRGDPWWVWLGFLVVAALVASISTAFYRNARLTAEPISPGTGLALAASAVCALILAQIGWRGPVSGLAWWAVPFSESAPDTLRFAVGLCGVLLLVGIVRLLRPARLKTLPFNNETRHQLQALGARIPGHADGVVLVDGAGFAFQRHGETWVGCGDPAGRDESARIAALWHFRDLCERQGVAHAFWQVGPSMIRAYEDTGLTAVSLGNGRYLACRAEDDPQKLLEKLR